ncbi:phospholipase [Ornithobacterium rhinotracheale]|uniref:alpha/beta hydrolase n=1 Tax=Ornithobacterium rhinotracheale TaxID=28251 RepID=UPI00129C6BB8|nr:alpha/beta fold hydrolase [Ornithobacterium rhinotracheale]MRJ09928.1 phospholipase [Ornithobacterium rhinotracheale]
MELHTDLSLPYLIRKSSKPNAPLLLLLHGYGSNEADLFSFAPELPEDFCVVALRAPIDLGFGGYAWYDINFTDLEKFNDVEQAQHAIALIKKCISELISTYDLNLENVWLCGFSQGAILSNALCIQSPENIKNVIMLSGYWASDIIGDFTPKDYSKIRYFISHGTEDTVIPIEWARKTPENLNLLGIKNVYHEYLSGHGIAPQNFFNLISFIHANLHS